MIHNQNNGIVANNNKNNNNSILLWDSFIVDNYFINTIFLPKLSKTLSVLLLSSYNNDNDNDNNNTLDFRTTSTTTTSTNNKDNNATNTSNYERNQTILSILIKGIVQYILLYHITYTYRHNQVLDTSGITKQTTTSTGTTIITTPGMNVFNLSVTLVPNIIQQYHTYYYYYSIVLIQLCIPILYKLLKVWILYRIEYIQQKLLSIQQVQREEKKNQNNNINHNNNIVLQLNNTYSNDQKDDDDHDTDNIKTNVHVHVNATKTSNQQQQNQEEEQQQEEDHQQPVHTQPNQRYQKEQQQQDEDHHTGTILKTTYHRTILVQKFIQLYCDNMILPLYNLVSIVFYFWNTTTNTTNTTTAYNYNSPDPFYQILCQLLFRIQPTIVNTHTNTNVNSIQIGNNNYNNSNTLSSSSTTNNNNTSPQIQIQQQQASSSLLSINIEYSYRRWLYQLASTTVTGLTSSLYMYYRRMTTRQRQQQHQTQLLIRRRTILLYKYCILSTKRFYRKMYQYLFIKTRIPTVTANTVENKIQNNSYLDISVSKSTKKEKDENYCPICYTNSSSILIPCIVYPCKHIYCYTCLYQNCIQLVTTKQLSIQPIAKQTTIHVASSTTTTTTETGISNSNEVRQQQQQQQLQSIDSATTTTTTTSSQYYTYNYWCDVCGETILSAESFLR